jgi:hypothetical protein
MKVVLPAILGDYVCYGLFLCYKWEILLKNAYVIQGFVASQNEGLVPLYVRNFALSCIWGSYLYVGDYEEQYILKLIPYSLIEWWSDGKLEKTA